MDSRAKATRFLAPITLRYRPGPTKDPKGTALLPQVKISSRLWVWQQSGHCGTEVTSYFHLPFHSPMSYNCLPIKKGSTFWPDLKAYSSLANPKPNAKGQSDCLLERVSDFSLQFRHAVVWVTFHPKQRERRVILRAVLFTITKALEATPKAHQQEWMNKLTNSHNGRIVNKSESATATLTLSVHYKMLITTALWIPLILQDLSPPGRFGRTVWNWRHYTVNSLRTRAHSSFPCKADGAQGIWVEEMLKGWLKWNLLSQPSRFHWAPTPMLSVLSFLSTHM